MTQGDMLKRRGPEGPRRLPIGERGLLVDEREPDHHTSNSLPVLVFGLGEQ